MTQIDTPLAPTDELLGTWNTNPANKPGNPYQKFPERASWELGARFRRADDTQYTKTQKVYRWAAEFEYAEVIVAEVAK